MSQSDDAKKASFVRRVRTMSAGDASDVAEFIKRNCHITEELAGCLPGLLQRLIAEETLLGVVVEYIYDDDLQTELAAFGLSGFISETSAVTFLASPIVQFPLALLHRALRGPVFLTFAEVAQANAG